MVYLPAGLWTDWWTGERMEGNRWIEVEADIETIPLYVREGAIIPMGPVTNYVGEVETKEILLKVSLFAFDGKSSFTVPAGGEEFEVEYFARGDGHTLFIGETAVSIKVEVLGGNEENLEVKYV